MTVIQRAINELDRFELECALKERDIYRKEKYPVIELNKEMSYRCYETHEGNGENPGYVLEYKWWQDDEWSDVSDLSEMKIWEYNELVDKLQKHYPDCPIKRLEGRFV